MLRSIVPRAYRHVCRLRPVSDQSRGIWSRSRVVPVAFRRPSIFDDCMNPRSSWPARMLDSQFRDMQRFMEEMMPSRWAEYGPRWAEYKQRSTAGRDVQVKHDDKVFELKVDVEQFSPEELEVKMKGDRVVISAKHEEKPDDYGWVSRQVTREFTIPENVEVESIESNITADGYLVVRGTVKTVEDSGERVINISREEVKAQPTDK